MIVPEFFFKPTEKRIHVGLESLLSNPEFYCKNSCAGLVKNYYESSLNIYKPQKVKESNIKAYNFMKGISKSLNPDEELPQYEEEKFNNNFAQYQRNTEKILQQKSKVFLAEYMATVMKDNNYYPTLTYSDYSKYFNREIFKLISESSTYKSTIKYALGQIVSESFPGLKPSSQWPVSLDDLYARVETLYFDELFYQPFDEENIFLKEALTYIKDKSLNLALNDDPFEKTYLLKALFVTIKLTFLTGNFSKITLLLTEMKLIENEIQENLDIVLTQMQTFFNKFDLLLDSLKSDNFLPVLKQNHIMNIFSVEALILHCPEAYGFDSCTSITTDGTYLYIVLSGLNGSILKVGTGYNSTIKGKVYINKPYFNLYEALQIAYLKGKLYIREITEAYGTISVYSSETLDKLTKIKLLIPEACISTKINNNNTYCIIYSDWRLV